MTNGKVDRETGEVLTRLQAGSKDWHDLVGGALFMAEQALWDRVQQGNFAGPIEAEAVISAHGHVAKANTLLKTRIAQMSFPEPPAASAQLMPRETEP